MLKTITRKRIATGEYLGEWVLDGYDDEARHSQSFATLAELDAYAPRAEAALLEVLAPRFPELRT